MQFTTIATIALGLAVANAAALPSYGTGSLHVRDDQAADEVNAPQAPQEVQAPQEAQAPEQKQDWVDGLQLAGRIAEDVRDANNPYGRYPYDGGRYGNPDWYGPNHYDPRYGPNSFGRDDWRYRNGPYQSKYTINWFESCGRD